MDTHTIKVLEFLQFMEILLRYASTALGRHAILKLVPYQEEWKIVRALKQTTEMCTLLSAQVRIPLAGIDDLRILLKQVQSQNCTFTSEQFMVIRETLQGASNLNLFLSQLGEDLYPQLVRLGNQIEFPDGLLEKLQLQFDEKGVLQDQATPRLAELRKMIRELEAQIREKMEHLQYKYSRFLQGSGYTIRKDHFVLSVRQECRGQVRGLCLDQSNSGETLFIEPQEVILIANKLEEVHKKESDEIIKIYWELTLEILVEEERLTQLCRILAVVDLTVSKARISLDFQMSEPLLNAPYLHFREARHPLLIWEKSNRQFPMVFEPEKVVPIDIHLGHNFDLLMITGPNTGGKTMVLKTVGLLVLMAHSGLHIPVKPGSTTPLFSQVYADIGDEQSISQSLSTFSGHLKNITHILREANENSLILLDEVGAGTDPDEGACLSTAILEQLLKKQAKMIVTTHLSPLKNFAYQYPRTENGCVEFNPITLKPTYRLLIGMPGNSNALYIAENFGISVEIIHRAKNLLDPEKQREKSFLEEIQKSRIKTEEARIQTEEIKDKTEQIKQEAEAERKELTQRKGRVEQEANLEIETHLRKVLDRLAPTLARLKNVPKHILPDVEELNRILKEELRSTPLGQRRMDFIETLHMEDLVYIVKFKKTGRIKKIDHKKEQVKLNMEGLIMDIPFDEISWLEPQ